MVRVVFWDEAEDEPVREFDGLPHIPRMGERVTLGLGEVVGVYLVTAVDWQPLKAGEHGVLHDTLSVNVMVVAVPGPAIG